MKSDPRPLAIVMTGTRRALRSLAGVGTGMGLLLNGPVSAAHQAAPDPAPMPAEDACATAPVIDEHDLAPIIERFIVPAKGFSLTGIAPAVMARFGAMQAAQARHEAHDWANLCRYRDQNAAILRGGVRPQIVFLGDSITEFWRLAQPDMFGDKIVDRGISGQTTPQILLRFYADVVALQPRVVHIMAGTNDIAGNTGPTSDDQIFDNIRAMLDIAGVNHIEVVLGSITPAAANSRDRPAARILALNARLHELARQRGAIFVDYHAALSDGQDGIKPALANDGLHPNRDGYAVMRPLTERALAAALR